METALIFEPYSINGLRLNHRIVMAPMAKSRYANSENVATELTAPYYKQRSNAALIITEGTFINEEAIGVLNVPGIYTNEQIEEWKATTTTVNVSENPNAIQEVAKHYRQIYKGAIIINRGFTKETAN